MGIQSLLFASSSTISSTSSFSVASLYPTLWLDASNAASLTLSGTSVTQWNDLSGNGFHATVMGTSPIYGTDTALGGMSVVKFSGSWLANTAAAFNLLGYSIAMVITDSAVNTNAGIFSLLGPGNDYSSTSQFTLNEGNYGLTLNHVGSCQQSISRLPAMLYVVGRTGSDLYIYANGTQTGSATTSANVTASSGGYYLGRRYPETGQGIFNLAEFIVFPNSADTDTRQKLEGYMAWKWGLTAQLPTNHPYKTTAPTAATDPYFANVSLLLKMEGDNGGTVFTDSSSYGVVLTNNGAFTTTSNKKFGVSGGQFGSPAGARISTSSYNNLLALGSGDFTLEYFEYVITAASSFDTVIDFRPLDNFPTEYPLIYISSSLRYGWSGIFASSRSITLNQWQHIAWVRSGSVITLYIDGVDSGSFTSSTNYLCGQFVLGATNDGPTLYYSRSILDELRITKGIARYTSAFTPPAAAFPTIQSTDPYFANVFALIRPTGAQGSTTVVDIGPTGRTLNNSSVTKDITNTKFGMGSMYFPSTNAVDSVSIANFQIPSGYTIVFECWINPWATTSDSEGDPIFDYSPSGWESSSRLSLLIKSDLSIYTRFSFGAVLQAGALQLNTWTHIAFTLDASGNAKTYINGISGATRTGVSMGGTNTLFIGRMVDAAHPSLHARLEEIRITIAQTLRYTTNFTPPTAPF